jgi:beta-glucosidase
LACKKQIGDLVELSRRSVLKLGGAGAVAAGVAVVAPPAVASASAPAVPTTAAGLAGDLPEAPVVQPGSSAAIKKAKALVAQMTLDEKIAYLHGIPATQGFTGSIPANTRLNTPALRLADGPSGVGNGSVGVTQWPDAKAVAASWDVNNAKAYGTAYGAEQAGKGHNVALAPCINILRLPNWGRSFETFTEDPYLNGQLAAATIRGIQTNYVIATVKHFVANNQEVLRNSIDDIVSQRALEEIYFPGFRAAVQQGGTGAVMTSYNKVNGTWASENRATVQDTLRDTWGFDGIVMSDWGGTHSTVQTAKAGSDMEMPGGTYFGAALKAAVQSGAVSTANLDAMVTHVLTAMFRVGLFDHPLVDPATAVNTVVSTQAHLNLARTISINGSVLLKNNGVLPLTRPASIAVIGDAADAGAQTHGGGSGSVIPNGTVVTPLAGIKARAGGIPVTYAQGTLGILALPVVPASAFGSGLSATYYSSTDFTGTALATATVPNLDWSTAPAPVATLTNGWSVRYTGTFTAPTAGGYRFSVSAGGAVTVTIDGALVLTFVSGAEAVQNAFVTLTAGAHNIIVTYVSPAPAAGTTGRAGRGSLHLGYQANYDQLHAAAAAAAKAATVAVVVVADVTSEGMDRSTLALPADQDALISAVAAANPRTIVVLNTSGAVLMPWLSEVEAVIANWYSGQEQGNAVAAMLFGDAEPGGRLTETFPASNSQGPAKTSVEYPGDGVQVYYDEGLAVGYRWYQSSGEKPLFPFGYGLSYTTFDLTNLRVTRAGSELRASVQVRNSGHRTGSEVVQLYVKSPSGAGQPAQQLKAFAKITLRPGQAQTVQLTLPREAFATWLNSSVGWTVVPGTYGIAVGNSSANLPLRTQVNLK